MDPDKIWETWLSWLGQGPKDSDESIPGRTIYAQVAEMLMFRQVWDGFAYVLDHAPERAREEGTFVYWVRFSYSRSQALAVRRMADRRSDVVSLGALIDSVWKHPWVLTRERYVAARSGIPEASSWFDTFAGAGDWIDPRIPAQDFDELQSKTKAVRDWVNTSVAHLTAKNREADVVTLKDVHDAVDVVADLFAKYLNLIGGITIHPGVIMEPWPTVFRVPWIPDDDQFREVLKKLTEAEMRRSRRASWLSEGP